MPGLHARRWLDWKLTLVVLVYLATASALLIRSHGLPYASDGNETFSSAVHARNLSAFSWRRSYGLTDESYGTSAAAHPYIHSHQGNFPRLFTYGLYLLGARSVEAQIGATAFTVGLAAMIFAFLFLSRAINPSFAVIGSLVFISDYFLFGQWHLNTYRVWHCFFFFSSLLCALSWSRRPARITALVTVLNFVCLCYWEYVFAFFVLSLAAILAVTVSLRNPRRIMAFIGWQLAGVLGAATLLGLQLAAYMGWDGVKQDIAYTLHGRNSAFDETFVARATAFYARHKVLWWPNYVDAGPLRHLDAFCNLLLRYHLVYYSPWIAFLMVFSAIAWLLAQWKIKRPIGLSLLLASVALIIASLWVNDQSLFDWSLRPLWAAAGWPDGIWQEVGLFGTTAAALLLLAVGPKLVAGKRARAGGRILVFVGAGMIAYALTYRIFTGYVFSGYLNRQAPFLVFLSDPLLALVLYLPISLVMAAWARWKWSRRLPQPVRSRLGGTSIMAVAAGCGIVLSLCIGWMMLQREYFGAMPPDRYEFIKKLASPPFRNKSFVVNTYAAPISVETHSWAYMEPSLFSGNIHLTRSGFQLDREDTYKWLADFGQNPSYEKPAYALIVRPTGWSTVFADYLHAHGLAPAQAPLVKTYGLLRRTAGPFSSFLHYRMVASDEDPDRDAFSIVQLDWDYPAFLRPLLADESMADGDPAPAVDQDWLIEVQSIPGDPPDDHEGLVRVVGISTESEHLNLAAGTIHVASWAGSGSSGPSAAVSDAAAGPVEFLQATVSGRFLHIDLLKGPHAGRARLMINDLEGEVDLRASQPGIESLHFDAAKSFEDAALRPVPQAGQYVALRPKANGLQLAYQFKHQENINEENTRIDFVNQGSSGKWGSVQTVILVGKTGVPIDLFAFIKSNPDTVVEYCRIRRLGDLRSYLQWLADYFAASPLERRRAGVLGPACFNPSLDGQSNSPIRHIFLPLPLKAKDVLKAWVRPGTRTKLGPIYPSNALDLAGRPKSQPRAVSPNTFEAPPPMLGSLDIDLRFPLDRTGRSEPLVTTGVPAAGDFVYVRYIDLQHVRIGFDHWGVGGFLSPPVLIDYNAVHHLRISMGSLSPRDSDPGLRGLPQADIDALKSRVAITIDNRIVLDVAAESYETPPASVTVGRNQIGGSTTGPAFTGQILHLRWAAGSSLSGASGPPHP
jgi:hypothetical protein